MSGVSGPCTDARARAQPSSRLYQRLDKLLLLSEGHTMYYGGCLRPP